MRKSTVKEMHHYLSNSSELLDKFDDYAEADYNTATFLSDTKVGFSIQRNYPENIRYKPAKDKTGNPDNIAVIWVVYDERSEKNNLINIPIRLRVAMMSKYRARNYDYDFEDDSCPTEDSVLISKSTPQPADLNLIGEYFYNSQKRKLVNSKNLEVNGIEILNRIYEAHCDSVSFFKHLNVKFSEYTSSIPLKLFALSISFLEDLLKNLFGRTLDEAANRSTYLDGYLKENFKKVIGDYIEITGYRASKSVIIIFCVLTLIFCFKNLPTSDASYLGNLMKSELLMLTHFIIALWVLDEVLPNVIFRLLNFVFRLRKSYINRSLSKLK